MVRGPLTIEHLLMSGCGQGHGPVNKGLTQVSRASSKQKWNMDQGRYP